MDDLWDYIADRWESDSMWKDQIILTVIVGSIGLTFAIVQACITRGIGTNNG